MSVDIVKDTFSGLLKKQLRAMEPSNRNRLNQKISLQWKANNSRRYNAQQYADEDGNIKDWKDYSKNTIRTKTGKPRKRHSAYYDAMGNKRAKPRKGSRYEYTGSRGELLRDTGRLRGSVAARGNQADIDVVRPDKIELGSRVPYAAKQHKTRPIISLSRSDRESFIRIYLKEMGLR